MKKKNHKTRPGWIWKWKKVTTTREIEIQYQCSHVLWQTFKSLYRHKISTRNKIHSFTLLTWLSMDNEQIYFSLSAAHCTDKFGLFACASNQAKTLKSKSFLIKCSCCFLFIFKSFLNKSCFRRWFYFYCMSGYMKYTIHINIAQCYSYTVIVTEIIIITIYI